MKPKSNFASIWLVIGAISLTVRVVSGYNRAESDAARAEYLTLVASVVTVAAVAIALGLFIFSVVGRATLAALRDDNSNAIFFQTSPASSTKNAVRYLQRTASPVQPQRFLTVYSPTVMIDESQLTIWRGKSTPELVLVVPRALITGIGVTEITNGIFSSAALQFVVNGEKGESILPLVVLREGSAFRSDAPEDVNALAGRIRDYLGLAAADAPAEPAS